MLFSAFFCFDCNAYFNPDRTLIPVVSESLIPFAPLSGYAKVFLPEKWAAVSTDKYFWNFSVSGCSGKSSLSKAEMRTGRKSREFEDFLQEIYLYGSQIRIIGPIGFPDKFNDKRERYFVYYIKENRMLTAIYGSVNDIRNNVHLNIEFVFDSDDFDYYDALSYSIICNVYSSSASEFPERIETYRKWVSINECNALKVPLNNSTPENAITSYYACLLTDRMEKARYFLYPGINKWPEYYNVPFRERIWWAVKRFKILYKKVYKDRMEFVVEKTVRQNSEDQDGVDIIEVKTDSGKWYISSFK